MEKKFTKELVDFADKIGGDVENTTKNFLSESAETLYPFREILCVQRNWKSLDESRVDMNHDQDFTPFDSSYMCFGV